MTIEELEKVPFYFVCSVSMEHEHTLTYESEDGRLGYCDHTPKRKNGDFGKGHRHWHIDGKVYKTKEKFIAALADFNPNVLPIKRRPYQNAVARMIRDQEAKPNATVLDMPKR